MLQLRMICDLIRASTYWNIQGRSRGSKMNFFRYFTYENIQGWSDQILSKDQSIYLWKYPRMIWSDTLQGSEHIPMEISKDDLIRYSPRIRAYTYGNIQGWSDQILSKDQSIYLWKYPRMIRSDTLQGSEHILKEMDIQGWSDQINVINAWKYPWMILSDNIPMEISKCDLGPISSIKFVRYILNCAYVVFW